MKKKLTLISILIFVTTFSQAHIVTGTLKCKTTNAPIMYASIVEINSDYLFVQATVSDSLGRFSLTTNIEGSSIRIEHLEYSDTTISVFSIKNRPKDILLTPKEINLNEIVVFGNKPLTIRNGTLVYNTDMLFKKQPVNNAHEMIRKLPGVTTTGDKLNLIGSPSLTILVNGKPNSLNQEQLNTYLSQIKPENVKKIEIMYSAPPELHTKGGVINILTKRRMNSEGKSLSGAIDAQYLMKHYTGWKSGLSTAYSTEKLSINMSYNYTKNKDKTSIITQSRHTIKNEIFEINQVNEGWAIKNQHSAIFDLEYQTKKGVLSLTYNLQKTPDTKGYEKHEQSISNNFISNNDLDLQKDLHNISIDYKRNESLKVGSYLTYYKYQSKQLFQGNIDAANQSFLSDAKQKINTLGVYFDNKNKLPFDWILGYGSTIRLTKDNSYQVYSNIVNHPNLKNSSSNIGELISSAYVSMKKNILENLDLNFSITGEFSNFSGSKDFKIFPQMDVQYTHSEKSIFMFAFSSNKNYPSYWEKQNYIGYPDGYSCIMGNPNLKPYNTYNANLKYILNGKYVFSAYHTNQPKYFAQQAYQSQEELKLIYQTRNWDYDRTTGVDAVIPVNWNKTFNSTLILNNYVRSSANKSFFESDFKRKKLSSFIAIDNTYQISAKPSINLNLFGYYGINMMEGIYDLTNPYNLDLAVKWTFCQGNATLTLKGTDLFNKSMPNMNVKYHNQDFNMKFHPDGRAILINMSYRFNHFKNKNEKSINTSRFKE